MEKILGFLFSATDTSTTAGPVTKPELFARISAAHTMHKKEAAALDSLPNPNMKDIF